MAGFFVEACSTNMVRASCASMGVTIRFVVVSSSIGAGSGSGVIRYTLISTGFKSCDPCGESC